jgi:hypothetical protein
VKVSAPPGPVPTPQTVKKPLTLYTPLDDGLLGAHFDEERSEPRKSTRPASSVIVISLNTSADFPSGTVPPGLNRLKPPYPYARTRPNPPPSGGGRPGPRAARHCRLHWRAPPPAPRGGVGRKSPEPPIKLVFRAPTPSALWPGDRVPHPFYVEGRAGQTPAPGYGGTLSDTAGEEAGGRGFDSSSHPVGPVTGTGEPPLCSVCRVAVPPTRGAPHSWGVPGTGDPARLSHG